MKVKKSRVDGLNNSKLGVQGQVLAWLGSAEVLFLAEGEERGGWDKVEGQREGER